MLTYTKEKVGVANGATNTAKKAKKKSKSKQRLCKKRCNRCQAAGDHGDPVKEVDTQGNTQGNVEESKEKIVAQHGYTKDSCEKWGDYKESCLAIMSLVSDSQIPFKCGNDVKNLVIDFDESSSASFKKATYKFEGESEDPKGKITRGKCHLHFVPTPALANDPPLARWGVKITADKQPVGLQAAEKKQVGFQAAEKKQVGFPASKRRLLQGGDSFDS